MHIDKCYFLIVSKCYDGFAKFDEPNNISGWWQTGFACCKPTLFNFIVNAGHDNIL